MKIVFKNYWKNKGDVNVVFQIQHIRVRNITGYQHVFYFIILNFGIILSTKAVKT